MQNVQMCTCLSRLDSYKFPFYAENTKLNVWINHSARILRSNEINNRRQLSLITIDSCLHTFFKKRSDSNYILKREKCGLYVFFVSHGFSFVCYYKKMSNTLLKKRKTIILTMLVYIMLEYLFIFQVYKRLYVLCQNKKEKEKKRVGRKWRNRTY